MIPQGIGEVKCPQTYWDICFLHSFPKRLLSLSGTIRHHGLKQEPGGVSFQEDILQADKGHVKSGLFLSKDIQR